MLLNPQISNQHCRLTPTFALHYTRMPYLNGSDAATGNGCLQLKHGTVVCDEIVEVSGWRIFASPWTPHFEGAFQVGLGCMLNAQVPV